MKLEQMKGRRQEIRGKQMIISYVGGDMECVYIYSTHYTHTHQQAHLRSLGLHGGCLSYNKVCGWRGSVCVCVSVCECVCVCECVRKRGGEGGREREKKNACFNTIQGCD